MLIFEVISSDLTEKSSRKYKCTSGPRKGQRVAKISTCSAPINHRGNYNSNDDQEPRAYIPKKSKKRYKKKKLRPHRANVKSESQVNEYGGPGGRPGGGNISAKAKVIATNDRETTMQKPDGTKITKPTKDLTRGPDKTIVSKTDNTDPKKRIKPGDVANLDDENK